MPTTYSQGATAAASAVGLALPGTGLFGSQTSDTTPGTRGQDSDPGGTGPFLIAMSFTAQANGMVDLIRANLAMANQVAGEFVRIGVVSGAYTAASAIPAFGSITWATDLGSNPVYVDVPVANVSNGNLSQLTDALFGGMRMFNGSAYTVLIACVNAAKNGYGGSRFFMGSATGVWGFHHPTDSGGGSFARAGIFQGFTTTAQLQVAAVKLQQTAKSAPLPTYRVGLAGQIHGTEGYTLSTVPWLTDTAGQPAYVDVTPSGADRTEVVVPLNNPVLIPNATQASVVYQRVDATAQIFMVQGPSEASYSGSISDGGYRGYFDGSSYVEATGFVSWFELLGVHYAGGIPSSAVWLANSPSNNWAAARAGEVYIYGAMHFASQFTFVPPNQFTYAYATAANMHVDLHLIHSVRNASQFTFVPPNQFTYSVGTTSSPVGTYDPHTSLNAWAYNKAGPFAWVAQHTSPCIRRRLPARRYGKFAMVAVTQAPTPNPPWVPPMTGPAYGT